MRWIAVFIVVVGLVLAARVSQAQPSPESGARVEHGDVALPPELARVLRDYERAWRAGDAAALAALFAEDGFVLQSNRPPVRGRAAIQAAYAGQGGGPLRLRALTFAAEDTIAYIIGAYGYGDAPGDTGKFTLTLRRENADASWQIASDMDNSNAPLRAQDSVAPAPTAQQAAEP